MAAARQRLQRPADDAPEWADNIKLSCAYARLIKTQHAYDLECLNLILLRDYDDIAWWDAPADIQERVYSINRLWCAYVELLVIIAEMPAKTITEAQDKRRTMPKDWLKLEGAADRRKRMREGCLLDDHLFPPSLKLSCTEGR